MRSLNTFAPHVEAAALRTQTRGSGLRRCLGMLVWSLLCHVSSHACAAELTPVPELGLRVAPGFRVIQFADTTLARDIRAMTADANGSIVVSGPGYIRRLLDTDGDGAADRAEAVTEATIGGDGLCYVGADLYVAGPGGVYRLADQDGDGITEGEPELVLPLKGDGFGGHGLGLGPDGWVHVAVGHEGGFDELSQRLVAPWIGLPEGGALLRLAPANLQPEAVTHGLRNPYDFDFNVTGDLFLTDTDAAGDFLLPWYVPARVLQSSLGAHQGWRAGNAQFNVVRPQGDPDVVEPVQALGRGWLRGMLVYRHVQFPPLFRNGLFVCDWTFGRIWFVALQPEGAGYTATPSIFLEAMGTHGFAPTDLTVTPDGSLWVCTGGHDTGGAVYRVDFPAAGPPDAVVAAWRNLWPTPLDGVLRTPQPMSAWARAFWEPAARDIGPAPFLIAVVNEVASPVHRVRAVEILTELFGGLDRETATAATRALPAIVRARVAWSLGRAPVEGTLPLLVGLAQDPAPPVRRSALEALIDRRAELTDAIILEAARPNLDHPDKRVRLPATRLVSYLSDAAWLEFWQDSREMSPQATLSAILAWLWRNPPAKADPQAIEACLAVLARGATPDLQVQALRLIIRALGGESLDLGVVRVFATYTSAYPFPQDPALRARLEQALDRLWPASDPQLRRELVRLLGVIESADARWIERVLSLCTPRSSATEDFHVLVTLARLRGQWAEGTAAKVAKVIVGMEGKLSAIERRLRQNWTPRVVEVVERLLQTHGELGAALLQTEGFAAPAHLPLVWLLGPQQRERAARLYLQAVQRDRDFPWSTELIELLSLLPKEEVRPWLRRQWNRRDLRDALLSVLAVEPDAEDADKFLVGLGSEEPQVVRASMDALKQLPRIPAARFLVPALRLLGRLLHQPDAVVLRARWVELFNYETGQKFNIIEPRVRTVVALRQAYQPIMDWTRNHYPALVRAMIEAAPAASRWEQRWAEVPWQQGNARRGQALFTRLGCVGCHTGAYPLGPNLVGVAARYSPADLMREVAEPNRYLVPGWRATVFETPDGREYTGRVAYEAAGQVMIRTGQATTVRLSAADIVSKRPADRSLMPEGLLEGLSAQQVADLYSYLRLLSGFSNQP